MRIVAAVPNQKYAPGHRSSETATTTRQETFICRYNDSCMHRAINLYMLHKNGYSRGRPKPTIYVNVYGRFKHRYIRTDINIAMFILMCIYRASSTSGNPRRHDMHVHDKL